MPNILHVLDHSLPDQDGYATRSHSILRSLISYGIPVQALTGPKQSKQQQNVELVDGIEYQRIYLPEKQSTEGIFGQIRTILSVRRAIRTLLKTHPIKLIHAHSPCLNGIAAMKLGTPFIYEMRSSWEDAAVSVGTTRRNSLRYRISRMLETYVAQSAQAVTVICDGLKDELIARGIDKTKIHVVPNALPQDFLVNKCQANGNSVRERHGLSDEKVIGFFGSFFEWEGIDLLVRAMPRIIENIPNARLLIAGGGRQERLLHELVQSGGLQGKVIFAGRVNSAEIPLYYRAADTMVFPRRSDRLTEMVTPLKPLEAMALETLVLASNVGGHRELVKDGETGLLFAADNEDELVQCVTRALDGSVDKQQIIKQAKQYVSDERNWSNVSKNYLPIYREFIPSLNNETQAM